MSKQLITPYLRDDMRRENRSSIRGETSEGLPFEIIVEFRPGAPKGALPYDIFCLHDTPDGNGETFIRQRAVSGLYVRTNGADAEPVTDEACEQPEDLLPEVVRNSDWW